MIQFNDYFRNAQTIIVTLAILVWGWMHFFHNKEVAVSQLPSAEVSHDIFAACLNGATRLVRVKIEVRNVGAVELNVSENNHSVVQVSPFAAGEAFNHAVRNVGTTGIDPGLIDWPESLANLRYSSDVDLQPNEVHEQYHDFVITPSARVIELTSTFGGISPNEDGEVVNWDEDMRTIYQIGETTCPQLPGSEASDD